MFVSDYIPFVSDLTWELDDLCRITFRSCRIRGKICDKTLLPGLQHKSHSLASRTNPCWNTTTGFVTDLGSTLSQKRGWAITWGLSQNEHLQRECAMHSFVPD